MTRHTPRRGAELEQNQNPRAPFGSIMILPRICSKLRHLRKIKAAVAKPQIKIQNRESCVGTQGETRKSRIQNHEAPGKDFRLNRENPEFRIQLASQLDWRGVVNGENPEFRVRIGCLGLGRRKRGWGSSLSDFPEEGLRELMNSEFRGVSVQLESGKLHHS